MRKKFSVFLCVLLVISIFAGVTASAQQPIRVVLDGRTLQFDVPPATIDGRTMVPMRVIFEALGAEINWNDRTRTITATRDNLTIIATIGSRTMTVNGARTEMDVAPTIIDGRTLVPVRFVSEAFGTEVDWNVSTRTVNISSQQSDINGSGVSSPPVTTPQPPQEQQSAGQVLVGTWNWEGTVFYVFNANGTGTMVGSDIRWWISADALFICTTPELCGNACTAPNEWDFVISGNQLTLTSRQIDGMTFQYTRG